MVEGTPRFKVDPINVIRTINETAIRRGFIPQAHQFYKLGQIMIEDAKNKGLDPGSFSLSDGQRLDIWVVEGGDMGIQIVQDRQITDFAMITIEDDAMEEKGFSVGIAPSDQLGRLMIVACEEVLGMDLTPQPLYKGPKE